MHFAVLGCGGSKGGWASGWHLWCALTALGVLLFSPWAAAQADSATDSDSATQEGDAIGQSTRALPAIVNVGVAAPNVSHVAVAGGLGYGFMGSSGGVSSSQRFVGSLAASYSPTQTWAFGADLRGRVDAADADQSSNLYGEPRLIARYSGVVTPRTFWGAELDLRLIGAEAPSIDLAATSPTLRGLFSWRMTQRAWLTTHLGFALDRSAEAVPNASRVSVADKQSLGASSWNGVPWGVGTSYRLPTRTELLAELGGQWLVGSDSPAFLQSPIELGLGARQPLSEQFSLLAAAAISLSERPDSLRGPNLVPIEPRIGGVVNLVWHLDRKAPVRPKAAPPEPKREPVKTTPKPVPVEPAAIPTSPVRGSVVDEGGRPLSDVEVKLVQQGADPSSQRTDAEGHFEFANVPLQNVELVVAAEGYDEARVNVGSQEPRQSEIMLRPAVPAGQVRGKVLDLKGQPVAAQIRITPGDQLISVQADGSFELELTPGNYVVKFEHADFATQQRRIRVYDRGVVILNIALIR